MRFGSAKCNRYDAAQSFNCGCSNDPRSQYTLLADSLELACGPLTDFCMSGAAPIFDGKEVCAPMFSASDSNGCSRSDACGAPMALSDGVSLAQFKQRDANCTASPGGGSECSCIVDDTAFLFHLSSPPDGASCEASIPNCDPHAVIKATGAATCKPLYPDDSGGDTCQQTLSCLQDATVDNRSIVAEARLALACARAAAGMPWWCSCGSDQETTRFQLGAAGANAAQACSQAPAVCLEHLSLHLGPAGYPLGLPDPLP